MKYMTQKYTLPALLAISALPLLSSCFKTEPLNAECDIEQAYIHAGDELENWFANAADTLVSVQSDQTQIAFNMRGSADLTKQAPLFRLTPGATIQPENGSTQDFSNGPVTYTVTSEDKQWTRTYQVSIKTDYPAISQEADFGFEDTYLSRGYYNWRETLGGTTLDLWATGNAGYKISNSSTQAENYPTAVEEEGYEGKAVKLTTRRTSMLADMVKKPIAAGNLFIGQFDATDALRDAMKATKFGKAFSFGSKPARLEGWYKYQPGDTFTDKDMNTLDRQDYATIYAVLYDNHDTREGAVLLYGDDVQTSPQIVALALVGNTTDTDGKTAIGTTPQWQHFSAKFDYDKYGKTIDPAKLKNGGYSLTIVCSSSTGGASFMGAVGSTLWVDSFKIICE